MQKLSSLNTLFQQYLGGVLKKKQFEELFFESILESRRRFHLSGWNRDEYIDYICWLYPRISRAVDSYRETGASFDAYISAMIRWSAREYRSRLADHQITESAAWTIRSSEIQVYNSEPEYLDSKSALKPVVNPRQILLLLLKSYYFVSDDFLTRMAPSLGMELDKLYQIINNLRNLRLKRDEEIRCFRERIYCQFYRCITFEKRLNAAVEHSAHYARMESQLIRARHRLTTMRKRLAGIRLGATNQQIAEVLGIPKGTVDSNLSALRERMSRKGRRISGNG
jgi:hypothetical protein